MATLEQIALCLTPGIGPTVCRRLIDICSAEELFTLGRTRLVELFGTHSSIIANILNKSFHARAEQEMRFMQQHGIRALFFTEPGFPQRLNNAETADCPAILYLLGDADLNAAHSLAVVGTRRATPQGRDNTQRIVRELEPTGTTIVSGLAYGIDTAAHTAALDHQLPTVAVLGHGLDRIYPPENRKLAERIIASGGALATEYPSTTPVNPKHFPARNRIIAALADATLVVEASEKGGALITAAIAIGYHRDLFAIPGRLTDPYSAGTNNLIATNKAQLVRSADDIAYQLGWPLPGTPAPNRQQQLFPTLDPVGVSIVEALKTSELTLDEIASRIQLSMSKTASILFDLEMQGIVRTLPGHLYHLCRG